MCGEGVSLRITSRADLGKRSVREKNDGFFFLNPGEMRGHFQQLVQALADKKVPFKIISLFKEQEEKVLRRAAEIPFVIGKEEIPFLMGIPANCLSFRRQAEIFNIVLSKSFLFYNRVPSVIAGKFLREPGIPSKPYFLFGIENGRKNLGRSWETETRELEQRERHGLSVEELFALYIQNRVLATHSVLACPEKTASYMYTPELEMVPRLILAENVGPKLEFRAIGASFPDCGTPSCRFRECFL